MPSAQTHNEAERVRDLRTMAARYGVADDLLRRAIDAGTDPDSFGKTACLPAIANTPPPRISQTLGDVARGFGTGGAHDLAGFLREFARTGEVPRQHDLAGRSQDLARALGSDPEGVYIDPAALSVRGLEAETAASGGYLVGNDLRADIFAEVLRPAARVIQAGATTLTGLEGNVSVPTQEGGVTASWLAETETLTVSDQSFGSLNLTPKRCAAGTAFSKQLIAQAARSVEDIVRRDILAAIGAAVDTAALNGAGTGGEPLGVLNNTGIGSEALGANGAAPTRDVLVEMENAVEDADLLGPGNTFLLTSGIRKIYRRTEEDPGSGKWVWEGPDDQGAGRLIGYRALVADNLPTDGAKGSGSSLHAMVFGDWSELLIGQWGGLDVVLDPFTLKKSNQVELVIQQHLDVGVRRVTAFVSCTDAVVT